MEVSGAPSEDLLQRPWLPVRISGCQLLAKTWFGDSAYHIFLTDMNCVWEERMNSAAIQSRAQELNKRLRAPVKAFFSHLCEVARPCLSGDEGKAQISLTRREDGDVSLKLKSELAGLPFYWEFHCSPAPVTTVCVQLMRPLLVMSRLLQRQVEQLGDLLVRKDVEIQDYRENGATLSRERLQTDAFEEQTYREDFMAKALPVVCSEQQDTLGFDADLQQLYASVVAATAATAATAAHGNAQKRKLSEKEEEEEEKEQSTTEDQDLTPSLDVGTVSSEATDKDEGRSQNGRSDATRAKMADSGATQQSLSVASNPAGRPSSKPKKKKVVGLFR